jgi:hypothetical protein
MQTNGFVAGGLTRSVNSPGTNDGATDLTQLPVLQLGLAGFSAEQEAAVIAAASSSRLTQWELGPMAGADAWILNGQCTQHLGGGRVRVAARQPGGRSMQLELGETARPVAFATPMPPSLEAGCVIDIGNPQSILEAVSVFEFALAPQAAQFLLGAAVVEQQDVLGTGAFEVRAKGTLLATVDMRGDAAVLPSVRPNNFEAAVWKRVGREKLQVPDSFARTSLSELMWRYVWRSGREDLLPDRYRTRPIYFRRAPRVDPLLVDQQHLLVMRELAARPMRLEDLIATLGLPEPVLLRVLAALYYVGSVTCTRERAAASTNDAPLDALRMPPRHSLMSTGEFEAADLQQHTAPAPLVIG